MVQQSQGPPPSPLLVTGTVLFYLVAALSMVMANKWVLSHTEAPLFFLLTQLVIAITLFLAGRAAGVLKIPLRLDPVICKKLLPMSMLNVIGLSFSNFTLKHVDASFYQVARGLLLPMTVCTSYVLINARPSRAALRACGVVTFGFVAGVLFDQAGKGPRSFPSPIGVGFGVASSLTTAIHSVTIKRGLALLDGNTLDVAWYSTVMTAIILMPVVILAGESEAVTAILYGTIDAKELQTFVRGSLITGFFGFTMCVASMFSIKVTSPITHMVSSAVRGVAGSFLGVWLFAEVITSGRAASIAIILIGSMYYTWVKHVEAQAQLEREKEYPSTKDYDRLATNDIELGDRKADNRD